MDVFERLLIRVLTEPVPHTERNNLFATWEKGKVYTKLGLNHPKLDAESQKYLVTNTQKGLLRYMRLPFCISFAPGSSR